MRHNRTVVGKQGGRTGLGGGGMKPRSSGQSGGNIAGKPIAPVMPLASVVPGIPGAGTARLIDFEIGGLLVRGLLDARVGD